MRDRAFRIKENQRRKNKAKIYSKRNNGFKKVKEEELKWYEQNSDHLASCSCWMCGNQRKYFGEETIQEKKFEEYANSFVED